MSAAIPTHDYRRTGFHTPPKPLRGLDAFVHRIVGAWHRRKAAYTALEKDAQGVEKLGPQFKDLSTHMLHQRLMEFRSAFRRGGRPAE